MNTTDSNTVSYKCTNCGAPLHYTPGVLSIHCKYCDSTVAIKQEKKEEIKSSDTEEAEVFDFREGTIVRINRLYIPCWTDDVNIYTDDKELQTSYFDHRTLFIIASEYIDTYYYSNNLLPWDRNQLIPIDKEDLENKKILLFSFDSKISENSNSIILDCRKGQFEDYINGLEDREKDIKKIKKANLVLLPIYEYSFIYRGGEYSIFQNGYEGELAYRGSFWGDNSNIDSILNFIFAAFFLIALIGIVWWMWKIRSQS